MEGLDSLSYVLLKEVIESADLNVIISYAFRYDLQPTGEFVTVSEIILLVELLRRGQKVPE